MGGTWREVVTKLFKQVLIVPPVVLGVLIFLVQVESRKKPELDDLAETPKRVRVIRVDPVVVIPRALGYGSVQPGKTWKAVAQVGGKIVELSPHLRRGAFIPVGMTLLRIDPAEYDLDIAEAEASIRSIEAKLEELDVREKNNELTLKIEQGVLELRQNSLERKRMLLGQTTISQTEFEEEERAYLAQEAGVLAVRNSQRLLPAERKLEQARLAQAKAQLADAQLRLKYASITAPFTCVIAETHVEEAQYVTVGQVLALADSIDVAEVHAQFPMVRLRPLLSKRDQPVGPEDIQKGDLGRILGLSALVRLATGDASVEWPARFARMSDTTDPETRTFGVFVAVDKPYEQVVPGIRPPLVKGMYCEVELRGEPQPQRLIVPRAAVHEGHVYLLGQEDRLEKRKVVIAYSQSNFAVLEGGLNAGDAVVVSDLIPAIVGMRLAPVVDETVTRTLAAEARGEAPVR